MAGIGIDITGDAKGFLRSAKQTEGALEDVADSLDDLVKDAAKDGDKLGDNLEDGVKDGTKSAEKSVEKLERSFSDLAKESKKESAKAGDDIGRNVKRGTDKAGEGLDEFKNEANSTAKESAASFDGSAESIGDSFQEIAANAFAGFGPAGALAGIAAAAGIGIVFAEMTKGAEQTAAFKERVGELAAELIETGDKAGPSLEYIVDRMKELAAETDDAETSLQDLYDVSKKSGSSFEDLAQAYAGNVDGLKDLQKAGKKRLDDLEDEADAIDTTTNKSKDKYGALLKEAEGQEEYNKYLEDAAKLAKDAAKQEDHYAQSGAAALEARAEAAQTLQAELDGVLGLYDEFYGDEDSKFDPAGYVKAMGDRITATQNFAGNVTELSDKWQLTTDETQAILDQGIDFGPMLAGIMGTPLEAEFVAKMQAAVSGGEEVLNGATLETSVAVDADVTDAEAKAAKVASKKRTADVKVKPSGDKTTSTTIDKVASKKRTAKITVKVDKASAETSLTNLVNKRRSVTIVAKVVDEKGRRVD